MTATNLARFVDAVAAEPSLGNDVAAGLSMLQAFGAQDTNEEGEPVHLYELELNADGSIFLNGNDMTSVLGIVN
ncbi:MAG: hypothetical protein AAFX92_21820 [Pseudomonadota bacterium]